ncbi:MAG: MerR family transcriptional regulator [Gaiellales bacterium]
MTVSADRDGRPLTIGAVCRRLRDEFPDISISKIRYLEDQGLLAPERTEGGYRLFTEGDFERLRTILRLQRDEFLPLRVIRDELDSPAASARRERQRARAAEHLREPDDVLLTLDQLCERAGVTATFAKELQDFGLIEQSQHEGKTGYAEVDADVASLCAHLRTYNLEPRNLRSFRTLADREASLLEQVVATGLRSRNPERRQTAVEDLNSLASVSSELSKLLFYRALRAIANGR